MTIRRVEVATLDDTVRFLPAPPASWWLAAIPIGCLVLLLAGTPVNLPLAGRTLSVGPFEAGVLLLVLLTPVWWRRLPPLTPATAAGVLFIGWCGLSTVLWSVDMRRSAMAVLMLVESAVVFVICYNAFEASTRSVFLTAQRAFGLILSVQILWVVFHIVTTGDLAGFSAFKSEARVPLGGSNFLAVFLEFCVVYELVRGARGWWIVVPIEVMALLGTFSRGALIALAGGLALVGLWFLLQRGRRLTVLMIAALVGGGAVALTLLPLGRLLLRAFWVLRYTAASRRELWSYAWNAAAGAPFTGIGFGAYESVGGVRDPHTTPLKLLAETGMPGAVLFAILFGGLLVEVLAVAQRAPVRSERWREAWAIALGILPVAAHSLIEPFFFNRSMFWVTIVFAWMAALGSSPAYSVDRGTVGQ